MTNQEQLAQDLRTAMQQVKGKLRLSDQDIGALAILIAQRPVMSRWVPRDRDFDFRNMGSS